MTDTLCERPKAEIQLATYVQIALVVQDAATLKFIADRTADLERMLLEPRLERCAESDQDAPQIWTEGTKPDCYTDISICCVSILRRPHE